MRPGSRPERRATLRDGEGHHGAAVSRRRGAVTDRTGSVDRAPAWALVGAPGRAFVLIFVLHAGIQGFFLTKVPEREIVPHTRWEISAVAMALYERGAFADPYALPTGPTAHMPPFQPALMAAVYRLLGPTPAAGYVVWLTAIAFYGAMYGMLPWLAGCLGLRREAGLVGGLVGALIPRWPGFVEGLAAVAIGLMAVAFVRRWNTGRMTPAGSLVLGLAIGLAFHVTPSLLPVALGFLLFECVWLRAMRPGRRALLVLAGMVLACLPWTYRNATTLGGLVVMRSNFGLELRMGNHEGAGPTLQSSARGGTERHPRSSEAEARQVQELGEMEYMRRARHDAVTWIRSHPGEFLRLTGLRVAQFWFGPVDDLPAALGISVLTVLSIAGAWRAFPALSVAQRAAILIPLASYPLVYYVVGFEARYRQPVDGLALVLAATALVGTRGRRGAERIAGASL